MTIHELRAQGKSNHEIARITGHARNTVKKYLRLRELPQPKPRPRRQSKLDPFLDDLKQWMDEGIFNCEVLLEKLQVKGYTGGRTIPKDYVQRKGPEPWKTAQFAAMMRQGSGYVEKGSGTAWCSNGVPGAGLTGSVTLQPGSAEQEKPAAGEWRFQTASPDRVRYAGLILLVNTLGNPPKTRPSNSKRPLVIIPRSL